jgi:hypothetical protein
MDVFAVYPEYVDRISSGTYLDRPEDHTMNYYI